MKRPATKTTAEPRARPIRGQAGLSYVVARAIRVRKETAPLLRPRKRNGRHPGGLLSVAVFAQDAFDSGFAHTLRLLLPRKNRDQEHKFDKIQEGQEHRSTKERAEVSVPRPGLGSIYP
jgi:hypothetical protein